MHLTLVLLHFDPERIFFPQKMLVIFIALDCNLLTLLTFVLFWGYFHLVTLVFPVKNDQPSKNSL